MNYLIKNSAKNTKSANNFNISKLIKTVTELSFVRTAIFLF